MVPVLCGCLFFVNAFLVFLASKQPKPCWFSTVLLEALEKHQKPAGVIPCAPASRSTAADRTDRVQGDLGGRNGGSSAAGIQNE